MNLGTWRIAIIVALVVVGVAVLANGFDETGGAVASPTVSVSPSPDAGAGGEGDGGGGTEEPPDDPVEQTPAPNTSGVQLKVFNGTSVNFLAADVAEELVAAGQVSPETAADAPADDVARTTIYFRGGPDAEQNQADATYLARRCMRSVLGKMPAIEELSSVYDDLVGDTITVVVVLGEDYGPTPEPCRG